VFGEREKLCPTHWQKRANEFRLNSADEARKFSGCTSEFQFIENSITDLFLNSYR
jgi:hypothetical protein